MKKNILFAILLSSLSIAMKAQSDFRPGYIILNSNDTLKGKIDYRGDLKNSKSCSFYNFLEGKKNSYNPTEIKEYGFIGSKKYISREIEIQSGFKTIFLEYLIKGELNIYYYRDYEKDHYLVERNGFPLKELPYEEHEIKKGKEVFLVKSKRHIGILKYILQDCPEIFDQIETIIQPNHENLIKLAQNYHNMICPESGCQIYKKEYPAIKLSIEPVFGKISIRNEKSQEATPSFYGGLLYFWLPRINEKLYFRTGLLHTQVFSFSDQSQQNISNHIPNYNKTETFVYNKIPLQVFYKFPKWRIKPTLGYGATYYPFLSIKAAANMGLNIYITKNIAFALEGEMEFNSKLIFIPDSYWSKSLSMGLVFDL